jgi:hypothetical protein
MTIPNEYALGRRPPKNAPALTLRSFLKPVAPAHPTTVDYLSKLSGWQMLGNDRVGDCNAVTWSNMRRLVSATLATEKYPDQDQVFQFYKTQNPNFDPNGTPQTNGPGSSADQGMDVQTGLEYLSKTGGPDGVKAVAFAKVDPTDVDEVQAALAIFGCLWLGILVLNANMQEFNDGKPWTDVTTSSVDGGHAILAGGYDPDVKFITWAQETEFSSSFWNGSAGGHRLVEEAWVVIWPEHLGSKRFLDGVDLATLAADYQAITGRVLPLPQPVPTPAPSPTPSGKTVTLSGEQVGALNTWADAPHVWHKAAAAAKAWHQATGH